MCVCVSDLCRQKRVLRGSDTKINLLSGCSVVIYERVCSKCEVIGDNRFQLFGSMYYIYTMEESEIMRRARNGMEFAQC